MGRRVNGTRRREGRRGGFIWGCGAVAFVAALLYWEQAALLYILSTLALCGLLLVVAFSNLESGDRKIGESTLNDKEAAAVGGEVTTVPSPVTPGRATGRGRREAAGSGLTG